MCVAIARTGVPEGVLKMSKRCAVRLAAASHLAKLVQTKVCRGGTAARGGAGQQGAHYSQGAADLLLVCREVCRLAWCAVDLLFECGTDSLRLAACCEWPRLVGRRRAIQRQWMVGNTSPWGDCLSALWVSTVSPGNESQQRQPNEPAYEPEAYIQSCLTSQRLWDAPLIDLS